MKDAYREALEIVVNELDNKSMNAINIAEELLDFIHALCKLLLVLVDHNAMFLLVKLNHIDDSSMKAKYN